MSEKPTCEHPTPDPDRAYTLWAAWLTHTAQEGTAHE